MSWVSFVMGHSNHTKRQEDCTKIRVFKKKCFLGHLSFGKLCEEWHTVDKYLELRSVSVGQTVFPGTYSFSACNKAKSLYVYLNGSCFDLQMLHQSTSGLLFWMPAVFQYFLLYLEKHKYNKPNVLKNPCRNRFTKLYPQLGNDILWMQ